MMIEVLYFCTSLLSLPSTAELNVNLPLVDDFCHYIHRSMNAPNFGTKKSSNYKGMTLIPINSGAMKLASSQRLL